MGQFGLRARSGAGSKQVNPLRLIRGAPGSGKTALVFREFKAAFAESRDSVRIVAPTATLVRHFRHELARDGMALPPHAVISMNRFVRECAGDRATAPDRLARLIVRDALRRLKPPEFAQVASCEGMADVVVETIRILENTGCGAARFGAIRGLGPAARAFGRVWAEIDASLGARGFVGRTELFAEAAKRAAGMKIWLDGFVTLSPLEGGFLKAIASRCDLAVTSLDDPRDEVRRWALACGARDRLLSGAARRPTVVSIQTADIEREGAEIARRIIETRQSGAEYRDIGVAVRDVVAYRPLLEAMFDRFGIPARFYFSRQLRTHPAAVFLSGLIRCALEEWKFEPALAALRAHPGWSTASAFDRFDFAACKAMPSRGAAALVALAGEPWLREKLEVCFAIEAWTSQQRTPVEWKAQIEAWASAVYRPGRVDEPGDPRDLVRLRSHARGLRTWLDAVETAVAFWPANAGRIDLKSFWEIASDAVDTASVQIPDDRADAVHVMDALEARQWNLSALFVCGLTDRDYPRKHPGHLLLTQSDVDRLRREGIRIRTAEDQDEDEFALFHALETRASNRLVLTCPLHDSAGRGVAPSQFLERGTASGAVACAPAAQGIARVASAVGRITSAELLAAMAARHATVSTTHIESLAQCRFQFFARKTLRMDTRPERPHERINPREAGLILHTTLELWQKDRTQNFAELFEQTFEEACRDRHLPRGFRLEVERFTLRGIARAVSATELWIAERSEAEVEVSLPLIDGVTMTGRVDRVDHMGGGNCIVVDYKSRGAAGMKRLIESETSLQGPLYSLALRRNHGLNAIAMVYWAVREKDEKPLYGWGNIPGYHGDLAPIPENWENAAWTRTAARLADFFAGNVAPEPTHADACRYCDARDCCRVEETQSRVMIEAANG